VAVRCTSSYLYDSLAMLSCVGAYLEIHFTSFHDKIVLVCQIVVWVKIYFYSILTV